ncbi:hypothetical protein CDV36_013632 [Fusarium kuroshium]|uniref:Uncharacterized protein n=1 Tax=Fusarium kuroshium TaxID=2010991 RepID=A0A3M2RNB5_9HYPO|nr:hypothetical protein CDV36_013632 [Fusarium kuroshium]
MMHNRTPEPTQYPSRDRGYKHQPLNRSRRFELISFTDLFALGTAGLLAIQLTLDFLRTPSLRSGRILSSVRLIMDVGAALDKHVFEQASVWDGDQLDSWVETVELQCQPAEGHEEASVGEDGDCDCCMRLRQIPRSRAGD